MENGHFDKILAGFFNSDAKHYLGVHRVTTEVGNLFGQGTIGHRLRVQNDQTPAPAAHHVTMFVPILRSENHAIKIRRMAANSFDPLQWIGLGTKFIIEELPDYVTKFQSNLIKNNDYYNTILRRES